MKTNKPYNLYNFKANKDFKPFHASRVSQPVKDYGLSSIRRNFQTYKPWIGIVSQRMFWASIAITLSFLLSQIYLSLSK